MREYSRRGIFGGSGRKRSGETAGASANWWCRATEGKKGGRSFATSSAGEEKREKVKGALSERGKRVELIC